MRYDPEVGVTYISRFCAAGFLVSLTAYCQAPVNDQNAVRSGFLLYSHRCAACHGKNAEGGRGPDLTRGALSGGQQDAELFRVIANGVPGTEMRAYGERMQPEEIWRMVAFLRSTNRGGDSTTAGDSSRGETLFWEKGGCGNCHTVGSRGNRMGPDLTNVGRRRASAYLRAALVAPEQDITGGYEAVTVVTSDGKTIRGIQKALDDFSVQFMDMQGNYYSFDRSQVKEVHSGGSLMPGYGSVFSAGELDDLLAYLLSLRGKETRR